MNLKIPCTSCSDWQPSTMCCKPVSLPCCSCCCWPRWRLMSSGCGHLVCRWLAPAVFCTGHGPLQFQLKPGEHPGPSTHKHTTDPHSPPAHTDSDTNMHPLVNTYTYKNIHMHTNMHPLTQANTKLNTHIIIALSLFRVLLYLNAHWHCSVLLFACTELNTHISWRRKKKKIRNWSMQPKAGTDPIDQFLYLHYSILSILCACSLSLHTFFFFLQLIWQGSTVDVIP